MKIYYVILIFAMYFNQYKQICGQGCLQCSKEEPGVCLICDQSLRFKKIGNSCSQVNIQNCNKFDIDLKCIECEEPFYPSEDKQECLESINPILNCLQRSQENQCALCSEYQYPINGKCQGVTLILQNCEFYDKNQNCIQCAQGYLLSPYQKKCIEKPDQNCAMYEQVDCQKCQENFIQKKNQNFNFSLIFNKFEHYIVEKNIFCELLPQIDENCSDLDLNGCNFCEPNYYLENGICKNFGNSQPNVQIIQNCSRYLNEFSCQECDLNFYPSIDRSLCLQKPNNLSCQQISNNVPGPICLNCLENQYLDQNQCFQRQNYPIKNCQQYSLIQDKCQDCAQFYEKDQSQNFCQTQNCLYFDITLQTCSKCKNGYFLNQEQCQAGSIQNCLEYALDSDTCEICDYTQRYELNQFGSCDQQLPIVENCQEQSQQPNSCDQCNLESLTIQLNQICQQKIILNCIQYDEQGGCSKCSNDLIPSFDLLECVDKNLQNCIEFDNGVCIKCNQGYYLYEQKCLQQFGFLDQYCFQNSIQNFTEMNLNDYCEICEENSISLESLATCFNKDFLEVQNFYQEGCISYLYETCIRCEQGKFLNSSFQCVSQCDNFQTQYLIKLFEKNILLENYCIEDDGCQIKSIAINQRFSQDYQYICQKCQNDKFEIIVNQNQNNSLINLEKDLQNQSQFLNFTPRVQCQQQSNLNIIKLVNNCQFYGLVHPSSSKIGCLKCNFRFRDKQPFEFEPQLDNSKCLTFDNNLCTQCQEGYLLNQNGFCYIPKTYYENCLEEIPQCSNIKIQGFDSLDLNLFSCHQCQNNDQGEQQFPVMGGYLKNNEIFNFPLQNNQLIECMALSQIKNFQIQGSLNNCQYFRVMYAAGQQQMKCAGCKQGYYNASSDLNQINCQQISLYQENSQYGFPDFTNFFVRIDQPTSENIFHIHYENSVFNKFTVDSSSQVIQCNQGYEIIDNLQCIELRIPKCLKNNQALNQQQFELSFVFIDLLKGKDYGFGCLECEDNLVNVYGTLTKSCHQRVNPFAFLLFSKFSQQNCKKYGYSESDSQCQICNYNYKLDLQSKQCVSHNYEEGCLELAIDQVHCSICDTNYYLGNGTCYLKNINLCEEYKFDQNLSCAKCIENYYWNGSECVLGQVEKCQIYQMNGQCQKCYAPFVLMNPENCISIQFSENFKCDQFELTGQSQFSCLKCKDLFIEQILDQPLFQCFFQEIENCIEYSNSAQDFSFSCLRCQDSKILKNGNCDEERSLLISYCDQYQPEIEECQVCEEGSQLINGICEVPQLISFCQKYVQNSNLCEKCQPDYILSQNKQQCDQRIEIQNCSQYDQNYNCIQCQENYYLTNICEPHTVVEKCESYSQTEDLCILCEKSYHLKDGICNKDSESLDPIENCLNHIDSNNCHQCDTGYYFNIASGICENIENLQENCELYDNSQNCIKCQYPAEFLKIDGQQTYSCQLPNNENCMVASSKNYYGVSFCNQCAQDHFFYQNNCYPQQDSLEKLCQQINSELFEIDKNLLFECIFNLEISNCQKIGNQIGICDECEKGYVLFNKNQCFKESNINENCLNKIGTGLKCKFCKNGYHLENGQCLSVQNDQGCFEKDSEGLCLTCKFGYYQNLYGICQISI